MTAEAPAVEYAALAERRLPPVIAVGCAALLLAIAGVVYLSSYIPGHPSLAPAIGLLAASAATVLGNVLVLSRIRPFAWWMFWQVWRWTMLAYAIIAGALMYVFVYDSVPGGQLSLLILTLAVFAIDIPLMLAFSVAGVDPLVRRDLWRLLRRRAAAVATFVVTTHAMAEAELCDRLALMAEGRLLAVGHPAEIAASTGRRSWPSRPIRGGRPSGACAPAGRPPASTDGARTCLPPTRPPPGSSSPRCSPD